MCSKGGSSFLAIMPNIDIIFLAYTKDASYHRMLLNALYTLRHSETEYNFDVKIIESNRNYKQEGFDYPDCLVITPAEEFNYNLYLNYGLEHSANDWVVVCNNDLLFTQGWFSSIMKHQANYPELKSISPYEPFWHIQRGFDIDRYNLFFGDRVSYELCGWCLVIHREIIDNCRLFDPGFSFIYQDNDYRETIKKAGYIHALAGDSVVYHLRFKSHSLIPESKREYMFEQQKKLFYEKWPE